jgi:hypothetical protein
VEEVPVTHSNRSRSSRSGLFGRPTTRNRALTRFAVLGAIAVIALSTAAAVVAKPSKAGFLTSQASMLDVLGGGTSLPILTVGDTVEGYTFDTLPDGISLLSRGKGVVDLFVNHETSRVPFPLAATGSAWQPTNSGNGSQNDFNNSQVSMLRLHQQSAGVLEASYVIPTGANYQRFCSNFLAGAAQGFSRPILFTNEEATDFVSRTGEAYPAPTTEPPSEQAGVAVAYDVDNGVYRSIYGLGRMNHENTVAIPGYDDLVMITGDDTFSAPSSQVYSYIAPNTDAVWNDQGHLYAFKSDNPNINDYGDLTGSAWVSGTFVPVGDAIADGPQTPLENWSNANNVFQFIRIEDIAYDRNDSNVVYLADTGEPRALQGVNPGPDRLIRGPSGTTGPYMNGRVWKMTLNPNNPLVVDRLEILIDADAGGYGNPTALHQPDNLETTAGSVLITEDPGGHNGGTPAKIWKYDIGTGDLDVAAQVNQSADGEGTDVDGFSDGALGSWESTGIVDASSVFGPHTFLVNIQAHSLWIETAEAGDDWTRLAGAWTLGPDGFPDWLNKREGGQLLLITIPGG